MKVYDVIVKTERGDLVAIVEAEDGIPAGLLLSATMFHPQLLPHLVALDLNNATALAITQERRLKIVPGLTVLFHDGVSIHGPLSGDDAPGQGEYEGTTVMRSLSAAVMYRVDVDQEIAEVLPKGLSN